jgi:hypothetical protein
MSYTPVQALQLLHSVESPMFHPTPGTPGEVPLAGRPEDIKAGMWEKISGAYAKVIADLKTAENPPVLSLKRRMVVGTEQVASRGAIEATLIFVEGFEPAIAEGKTGYNPYFEANKNFEPKIVVTWTQEDPAEAKIVAYRALTVSDGNLQSYDNPNHAPGSYRPWRCGKDFAPVAGNAKQRSFVATQGGAIFVSGTDLEVKVEGARVANLRIVRLAKPFAEGTSDGKYVVEDAQSPGPQTDADWSDTKDAFAQIYGSLVLQPVPDPPVLYLGRRPIVATGGPLQTFEFQKMNSRGIMLFHLEGFAGVEAGSEPKLNVRGGGDVGLARQPGATIKSRSGAGFWQPVGNQGASLKPGDSLFAASSVLTLEVENAQVAYVWVAGFGDGRPEACGSSPCP